MAKTDIRVISPHKVSFMGRSFSCATGRGGFQKAKVEGDGATPIGRFPLRQVFYRADRVETVSCGLPVRAISPTDGWCDDPSDVHYNQLIQHPYPHSAEHLWRDDHVYDLIIVVGHNDQPIIPGHGSAIFIHLARPDFEPTAGCVAFHQDDLLWILEHLTPETFLEVAP